MHEINPMYFIIVSPKIICCTVIHLCTFERVTQHSSVCSINTSVAYILLVIRNLTMCVSVCVICNRVRAE